MTRFQIKLTIVFSLSVLLLFGVRAAYARTHTCTLSVNPTSGPSVTLSAVSTTTCSGTTDCASISGASSEITIYVNGLIVDYRSCPPQAGGGAGGAGCSTSQDLNSPLGTHTGVAECNFYGPGWSASMWSTSKVFTITSPTPTPATPTPPGGGCPATAPTNLSTTNITATSAKLNWTPGSGGVRQLLRVSKTLSEVQAGCPAGSNCIVKEDNLATNLNTYQLNGLTAGTLYYWRIVTYNSPSCFKDAVGNFTAAGNLPVGSHEVSSCSYISGWVVDVDYTGTGLVQLYRDGPAGAGGTYFASVPTSVSRPDVAAIYPSHPTAGWQLATPTNLKDGVAHSIYAYGVNWDSSGNPGGSYPLLSGSPKSLTCNGNPTGTFSFTCGSPNAIASGTASDPQGSPVTVAIYDGPAGGGGAQIATGQANPNYSISVPSPTDGQVHQYYAYARDIPSGTWYQIGTQTFACPPTVQLTANPTTVNYGGSSTLTAEVSNSVSCTAEPGGITYFPSGGSQTSSLPTGPLSATTTYTLTCRNALDVSASDSATVTVNVEPPTASIVGLSDGDYCSSGASIVTTWQYNQTALPISAYQVQIISVPSGTTIYDTGKVPKSGFTPPTPMIASTTTPSGVLSFNSIYMARVRVWDTNDQASSWATSSTYTTKNGPWPQVSFTIDPQEPIAKQPVTFTDTTNYNGGVPVVRTWDFGDGTIVTESPGTGTIEHTYETESADITAQLTVVSSLSNPGSCSATQFISAGKALPIYKEVLPGGSGQ